MTHNKDDYILINKEIAERITKGTHIIVTDNEDDIEYIMRAGTPRAFNHYDDDIFYNIITNQISDTISTTGNGLGYSFGIILKSLLTSVKLFDDCVDDDLLIM